MNKSPNTKLLCYLLIAALTTFGEELSGLTAEAAKAFTWIDWAKMALAVAVPTVLVWRSFIDQSISTFVATPKPTTEQTETKP